MYGMAHKLGDVTRDRETCCGELELGRRDGRVRGNPMTGNIFYLERLAGTHHQHRDREGTRFTFSRKGPGEA